MRLQLAVALSSPGESRCDVSWIYLVLAIAFEVAGTTSLKLSDGLSRPVPSVAMFVLYVLSFASLSFALKELEVGIVYAIWAGIGTAAITLIGVWWFQESLTPLKIVSIALIIAGVVGLNLAGSASS